MAKHIYIHIGGRTMDAGKFEEGKHPRADNGQFGAGGGGKSTAVAHTSSSSASQRSKAAAIASAGHAQQSKIAQVASRRQSDPKVGRMMQVASEHYGAAAKAALNDKPEEAAKLAKSGDLLMEQAREATSHSKFVKADPSPKPGTKDSQHGPDCKCIGNHRAGT